jgi:molybdopterin-guanine dinucleotide biosynthesis protein A
LEHHEDLYGLILTGGRSSRMGTDKSLLVYHGKPQREFLFDLLGKFCQQVFISCREDQNVPFNLNPIADRFNFRSPLNGILSAFAHEPGVSWLVIAVDMPFVDDYALHRLISSRDKTKMATCFYNAAEKQPEPLLTLWEQSSYPFLLKFAQDGNVSPRDFLNSHPVALINPPNEKTIVNVNFPIEKP